MLTEQRLKKICELVNEKLYVTVDELMIIFSVSESTVRRDLNRLHAQKLIMRKHGGAISLNQELLVTPEKELPMSKRLVVNSLQKREIGKYASNLVGDGDLIYIDVGSTFTIAAPYFKDKNVVIVTTNIQFCRYMGNCTPKIILLGGEYDSKFEITKGTSTLNEIQKFRFDHVFIGAVAFDALTKTVYTSELDTLEIKNAVLENGNHRHLLIDSSKFNLKGLYKLGLSNNFNSIITDKKNDDIDYPDNVVFTM